MTGVAADRAQKPRQQSRRRRAVDIVVAEDRDPFARLHRVASRSRRRRSMSSDDARIGQIVLQRRIEIALRRLERDAARGEQPPDDLAGLQPLRDRERQRRIERTLHPTPPERRARDAERTRVAAAGGHPSGGTGNQEAARTLMAQQTHREPGSGNASEISLFAKHGAGAVIRHHNTGDLLLAQTSFSGSAAGHAETAATLRAQAIGQRLPPPVMGEPFHGC